MELLKLCIAFYYKVVYILVENQKQGFKKIVNSNMYLHSESMQLANHV